MNRKWLIGAVAALALMGCTKTNKTAKLSAEDNPYLSQGRVQFEDSSTKHLVEVVRVDSERVGSGLLKVTMTLRNRTSKNLWVDMRTTFLDGSGHKLEETNWEPILLDRSTVSEYTCTSLGTQAADYQIIMRQPKKSDLSIQ